MKLLANHSRTLSRNLGILVVATLLGASVQAPHATAGEKESRKCRKDIGAKASKLVSTALGAMTACHKSRNEGKNALNCNDLAAADLTNKVGAASVGAQRSFDKKCTACDPVRRNYAGGDPATLLSAIRGPLQTYFAGVLGAPAIVGDKAKVKCHKALAKAAKDDVADLLRTAIKCQGGVDANASTFVEIAPGCVPGSTAKGPTGEAAILKACAGLSGTQIGSCEPFPACVTNTAITVGQALARSTYGALMDPPLPTCIITPTPTKTPKPKKTPQSGSVCGDGQVTGGEQCDPGTDAPGDCCSSTCRFEPSTTTCLIGTRCGTCAGTSAACGVQSSATTRAATSGQMVRRVSLISRFGALTKFPHPGNKPATSSNVVPRPNVFFNRSPVRAGGGRTLRISVNPFRAATRAVDTPDHLVVLAGGTSGNCDADAFELPLPGSTGLARTEASEEDMDVELDFADELPTAVPIRVAVAAADGRLLSDLTAVDFERRGRLRRVTDLNGAGDGDPGLLTAATNRLFLVAQVGIEEHLFVAAGDPPVPQEVTDGVHAIAAPPGGALVDLTAVGDNLFFGIRGKDGASLWRASGTPATAAKIGDLGSSCPDTPSPPVGLGSGLVFASNDRATGCEPWFSDGSTALPLKNIRPGLNGSSPATFVAFGNVVFFVANDGTNGPQIWRTNGTSAGTVPITQFPIGSTFSIEELTPFDGKLYFIRDQTKLEHLLLPGGALGTPFERASIRQLTVASGRLFFEACEASFHCSLWTLPAGGSPAAIDTIAEDANGIVVIDELVPVGTGVFFRSCPVAAGCELWRSDGTPGGTRQVVDLAIGPADSFPTDLSVNSGRVFFEATDGERGREIWESDGVASGTVRIRDFLLGDDPQAVPAGFLSAPVVVGNTLYFPRDDGETGVELWSLRAFDGTTPPPTPTTVPTQSTASPSPGPTVTAQAGSCCLARSADAPAPACQLAQCASCVCAVDAFCCENTWDARCVARAADTCHDSCGCATPTPLQTPTPSPSITPGQGTCCSDRPTDSRPNCGNVACAAIVCGADPFCCQSEWDGLCATRAQGEIGCACAAVTATATSTPNVTATSTTTPTPTPTSTPTHTPTGTSTPSQTRTPTPSPTITGPLALKVIGEEGADLDVGSSGATHNLELLMGNAVTMNLQCQTGQSQCTIDGSPALGSHGVPVPLSAGGVAVCVINQFRDAVTGTYDPSTGCASATAHVESQVYVSQDPSVPCPRCNGDAAPNDGQKDGICEGGASPLSPCDVNADGPFGETSADCRPSGNSPTTIDLDLQPLTTGVVSVNASKSCTSPSAPAGACYCTDQATNNACADAICSNGVCLAGPMIARCSGQKFRSCTLGTGAADCEDVDPGAGTCVLENTPCFTGNINRSGQCGAGGSLASVFCVPPTSAPSINTMAGLPGPGALSLPIATKFVPAPPIDLNVVFDVRASEPVTNVEVRVDYPPTEGAFVGTFAQVQCTIAGGSTFFSKTHVPASHLLVLNLDSFGPGLALPLDVTCAFKQAPAAHLTTYDLTIEVTTMQGTDPGDPGVGYVYTSVVPPAELPCCSAHGEPGCFTDGCEDCVCNSTFINPEIGKCCSDGWTDQCVGVAGNPLFGCNYACSCQTP